MGDKQDLCLKKWTATGFYIIMTFCQNVIYFAPPSRQEPEYERIRIWAYVL